LTGLSVPASNGDSLRATTKLTEANLEDATDKRHTQHTDTGTTAGSFQLESGSSGARIKNSSGELQVRNAADSDYAPFGVKVIKIPDNLAEALIVQEGTETYLTFVTTNGAEKILIGKTLEIGQIQVEEDGGIYTLADMSVTSAPAAGTEESYSFKIDGSTVLKIYAESDGAGGVKNISLKLENGATLANKVNLDVDTGTETVDSFVTTIGDGVVWDVVVKKGNNLRTAQVMACWDSAGNVQYIETATADLGTTADLTLAVDVSGGEVRLRATAASDDWIVRVIRRAV
jgi:hypothetical protein